MYPVPATPRAYHPSFTRDIVQAILVVPQWRALVNSKPYPACLFSRRGRPSTDAPGVQISIMQRRRRKHLHQCHAVKSGAPPHQLNRRRYGAGTFKFGVPGLASGRVPQKHIGCAVTRQQTTQNVTSSCCWLNLLGRRSGVNRRLCFAANFPGRSKPCSALPFSFSVPSRYPVCVLFPYGLLVGCL